MPPVQPPERQSEISDVETDIDLFDELLSARMKETVQVLREQIAQDIEQMEDDWLKEESE